MVSINEIRGYSVFNEKPYVLADKVELPILSFLTDELRTRYKEILGLFAAYCKRKCFNPNCTTTWPYFVNYVRKECSNLIQRRFYNLNVYLMRSVYLASNKCAEKKPEVQFVAVEKDEEREKDQTDTRAAREARWEQGGLKDMVLDRVIEDPRPVLDLGGGDRHLESALIARGVEKEVITKDVLLSPDHDFSSLNIEKYEKHQVVVNHSMYHMPIHFAMQVLKMKPRGVTMVIDSDGDFVEHKGEDYQFVARRDKRYPSIQVYLVSGKIFNIKSRGAKGQTFTDEMWFTRKQWSDWGFNLYSDPSQKSSFVKRHVVLFDGLFVPSPSRPALVPSLITLSEGGDRFSNARGVQPLYELFKKEREIDLTCLQGQWHYHTPKIDGISMKLVVGVGRHVYLIDKMGLSYRLGCVARRTVFSREQLTVTFAVELLPKPGTSDTFIMYANQVMDPIRRPVENDALSELVYNVTYFNKMVGDCLLGIKDYFLVRNKVLKLNTILPHDGVVYMMAYAKASSKRVQVHCFHKPFPGTDTIPFVMASEQMRSRVVGKEFSIYYRAQALDSEDRVVTVPMTRDCVFSKQIQTLISSSVMNSSDYFGPTTVSPLMYEGYYVPAFAAGTQKDAFIVTHVRGDKERKDVEISRELNSDWLAKGVIGLTRWGKDAQDVTTSFFLNLTSTRVMKLLPSNVGVQANFLVSFFKGWTERTEDSLYLKLNERVDNGWYSNDVDSFLIVLRTIMNYGAALFFLDTLFRYPFVERYFFIVGRRVRTKVRFNIYSHFYALALDASLDSFGASITKVS